MDSSISLKDEMWFLRVCRHISNAVYQTDFSGGYFKSDVYGTRHANFADLKQRILECIQRIPKEMLRVTTAFPLRLQECIKGHGGHLQPVIFRQ